MSQQAFEFIKDNPFEINEDEFNRLNDELNVFLRKEEGELVGPPVRQETQDLEVSENNIALNPNLISEDSSVISLFDKTTSKYQVELAKELQREILSPQRQPERVFDRVNDNLNKYLSNLGEEQLEPAIKKIKKDYISGLENMLSTLDLTQFRYDFVNSIANDYFYDVLYDQVLHTLVDKIPEEQIKLETHLTNFEQGFVEKITKKDAFLEALKNNSFDRYFFKSPNCQDQIISQIEQFIDEKDEWGAAVFLSKYINIVANSGIGFSKEHTIQINKLRQRYRKEIFPNILLEFMREYKLECFKELKEKEKELRHINDTQKLDSIYSYSLFSFYPRDFEVFSGAVGDNFSFHQESKYKQIRKIETHFKQRLEDLKQARENQLKRIQHLGPRKQNTIQTTPSTSNSRVKVEVKEQKPKINLEELLKGATYTVNIQKEDRVGKIILAYDTGSNSFHLITNGIKEEGFYFIVNKDPKKFRDFTRIDEFSEIYGMHRNIVMPSEKSKVLGGGAYFTQGNRIHIDYKSGDFGRMNLELVKKCLENSGYELTIMDEKYFNDTPLVNLLDFLNN